MQVYTPVPLSCNYRLSLFESGDIKPWLQRFIERADAHMLSSQARLQLVPTFLAGQAASWHDSFNWSSWEEWCTAAIEFFRDSPSLQQFSLDIATIKADQFSDQYLFLEQFQRMLFNFFSGNSIYTLENPRFFEIQKYRSLHLFLDSLHPADAAGVETFEPKDVYEAISIYSKYASRPEVRYNDVFPKNAV
ncbi:hypothetical protein DSO57_1021023 [Entomophthora muscae]|uniref:Uncharacterized protein n=1 Tax=Entomophthora muscae TaxID=34485 RepID=A0ACC2RUJ5_9FUNG|nr:hypothetical protein DSO57_1021023 [Entomophthora muscae]